MITISVASYNGAPPGQPQSAQFDELGGTVGRADNNQLVLSDPERTVSRVHAQVVFRSGRYAVVNRGSNPITVNGQSLGNGQEAPVQAGDELQVGGYTLRVEAAAPAFGHAVPDPFADFGGLAATPPARAGGRTVPPTVASRGTDPLGGFGMAPSAPAAPSAAGGIPDDWDPFAPTPAAKGRPDDFARSLGQGGGARGLGLDANAGAAAPLIPDLHGSGGGAADSIDNLFGLGSAPAGADPLGRSALSQAASLPNMAANADPMKSLNSFSKGSAAAVQDNLSELQSPFSLPPMVPAAPLPRPVPPAVAPPAAAAQATPKGAVLSWDEPSGESRTIIRPKAAPAAPAVAPAAAIPDELDLSFEPMVSPMVPPVARPVPVPPAAAAPPRPRPAAVVAAVAPGNHDALAAALREGLGVPGLPVDVLTPELMKLLGQIVHEATRGTVDLLVARAALKREVRAEVTMIVARENNPLKFSPSVEVALAHLLNPPARGFMPPDQAMRDAYDDLRAHQFAFLAGMRAALEGVLKRFDPAVLESKLTQKSVLSSLLPASRKARMWDVFNDLYGQISAEASDDFHELFGKEFLRAYESHIDQLAKDRS